MQFTIQTIAAVAALLSAANAAPAPNTTPNLIVLPGTVHQPTQRSVEVVEKRGATDTYGDFTGQKSSYEDGSGKYVRSDDTHRYASGDKCWTDLYFVKSSWKNTNWNRASTQDCPPGATCVLGINNGVQTCQEWSISVSVGVDATIVKDVLAISGSVTNTYGESKCESVTTTNTCSMEKKDEKKCYAIWTSQNVRVDHGYIRRRCDFHDGKGDQTVWSKDYDLTHKAKELNIGCNQCSDTNYSG